jgi:DNA-binding transcriptional MocR family regulator
MTAALALPTRCRDTLVATRAAAAGVEVLPLSRYALEARANGLLLGYAALTEPEIGDGMRRLARVLRAGGAG